MPASGHAFGQHLFLVRQPPGNANTKPRQRLRKHLFPIDAKTVKAIAAIPSRINKIVS